MDIAKKYLSKLREGFGGDTLRYACFLQIIKQFKNGILDSDGVVKKVGTLLKDDSKLIHDFNLLLPRELRLHISPVEYEFATTYVKRVKNESSFAYTEFLNVLRDYQNEQLTIQNVFNQINQILSPYPDLLKDFYIFLPDADSYMHRKDENKETINNKDEETKQGERCCSSTALYSDYFQLPCPYSFCSSSPPSSSTYIHKMLRNTSPCAVLPIPRITRRRKEKSTDEESRSKDECTKMQNESDNDEKGYVMDFEFKTMERIFKAMIAKYSNPQHKGFAAFEEFCKCLYLHMVGILSVSELLLLLEDFFPMDSGDLPYQLKRMICMREKSRRKYSYLCSSLAQLDYSDCPKNGRSYQKLPKCFPKLLCSGRDEMCNRNLNDEWVSIPCGSEDFSFKHMRKNQYEENLFKCEDERFELDMQMYANKSAMKILKEINQQIEDLVPHKRKNFKLARAPFSIIHLKAITYIYGEHSDEILQLLIQTPADSIPIILNRLEEKQESWKRGMESLNNAFWKETLSRNYFKSFDHRSFYFRQADKRQSSVKGFVNQIIERSRELRGTQTHFADSKKRKKCESSLFNQNYSENTNAEEESFDFSNAPFDLTFDLSNGKVLADSFTLLKIAACRMSSGRVSLTRINAFLHTFVQYFFDIQLNTTEIDKIEEEDGAFRSKSEEEKAEEKRVSKERKNEVERKSSVKPAVNDMKKILKVECVADIAQKDSMCDSSKESSVNSFVVVSSEQAKQHDLIVKDECANDSSSSAFEVALYSEENRILSDMRDTSSSESQICFCKASDNSSKSHFNYADRDFIVGAQTRFRCDEDNAKTAAETISEEVFKEYNCVETADEALNADTNADKNLENDLLVDTNNNTCDSDLPHFRNRSASLPTIERLKNEKSASLTALSSMCKIRKEGEAIMRKPSEVKENIENCGNLYSTKFSLGNENDMSDNTNNNNNNNTKSSCANSSNSILTTFISSQLFNLTTRRHSYLKNMNVSVNNENSSSNNNNNQGDAVEEGIEAVETTLDALSDTEEEIRKRYAETAAAVVVSKKTGGNDAKSGLKNFWNHLVNHKYSSHSGASSSPSAPSVCFLPTVSAEKSSVTAKVTRREVECLIGNDTIFAVFRFLCLIYERLLMAKETIKVLHSNSCSFALCSSSFFFPSYSSSSSSCSSASENLRCMNVSTEKNDYTNDKFNSNNVVSATCTESMKSKNQKTLCENHESTLYDIFLEKCKQLADMQIDNNEFEDFCRNLLENDAYILFTASTVLQNASKTIFHAVNEYSSKRFLSLYLAYKNAECSKQVMNEYCIATSHILNSREMFAYKMDFNLSSKIFGIRVLSKKELAMNNCNNSSIYRNRIPKIYENATNENQFEKKDVIGFNNNNHLSVEDTRNPTTNNSSSINNSNKEKVFKYASNSFFIRLAYGLTNDYSAAFSSLPVENNNFQLSSSEPKEEEWKQQHTINCASSSSSSSWVYENAKIERRNEAAEIFPSQLKSDNCAVDRRKLRRL